MTSLSFKTLRIFVNQSSSRFFPKNIYVRTCNLRSFSHTVTSNLVTKNDYQNNLEQLSLDESIKKTTKLIREYPSSESIDWKEVIQKLKKLKIENHSSTILQALLKLQNLEAGISYFNYNKKIGEEFTPLELMFFLKLFSERGEISKHEDVVKYVYDNIKMYIKSPVIQNYIINLISEVPSCYDDFLKYMGEETKNLCKKPQLAEKALKFKSSELAFEFLSDVNISRSEFLSSYIDYMSDKVKESKFLPEMITDFFKLCEDNNHIINQKNFILFKNFVNTLNNLEQNYVWTLGTCNLDSSNVCSKCSLKLVDKCISQSDFDSLKEAFLKEAGFSEKAVFLNSSAAELQRFLEFLKNCKPYDIVFDGLNILHFQKVIMSDNLERFLKYFLDKGMRALIIARYHAKKKILNMPCLKNKKYKDKCQFFFTQNMSDDDLFVLYSALHGGLKTYLFSKDFLNKYGARFNKDLQKIFFKWKIYHQFVPKKFHLFSPWPSLGLSQLTSDDNGKKLIWHISYQPDNSCRTVLNSTMLLKWACLQAEKKS